MKTAKIVLLLISISGIIALTNQLFSKTSPSSPKHELAIIPQPAKISQFNGHILLHPNSTIFLSSENEELHQLGNYLSLKVKELAPNYQLRIQKSDPKNTEEGIHLLLTNKNNPELGKEGYELTINKTIQIRANHPNGIFYGIQSLLQLFPPSVFGQKTLAKIQLPMLKIIDFPRFKYRGMHLDVGRHFFSIEEIKKYIDLIALHKMNTFHWHLTEDQGWRIEIKKYPRLTEIGAKRKETVVEKNFDPYIGDQIPYEGYYTQEEIKEIVHYAKERYITVIPEIELPGHSLAALASYPQLGCTGGPYQTRTQWGVEDDIYCAGNEEVFNFLEDVLSEVMELFPSKYIHIGGDEAPKKRWKECPKCQSRIKKEGLADEHELQSYFIQRIERFLNQNGRNIIGWDEILEGGLAPNATVMSWRGTEGGVEAAKQQHQVIMTPGSHCYFDHYQANRRFQPLAIGGFTSLKKVYDFQPIPPELTKEESKYIIGAQGNVWTEYMKTYSHVEYMVVPRISALSEVVWSTKENRNWKSFQKRLQTQFKRYKNAGINYCKGSYHINYLPYFDSIKKQLFVRLESEIYNAPIYYTTNGAGPRLGSPIYHSPIPIKDNTVIKAVIIIDSAMMEGISKEEFTMHKGIGAKVQYKSPFHHKYHAKGKEGLVNGIIGYPSIEAGYWQGFWGEDMEVVLELQNEEEVHRIETRFMQDQKSWVFMPLEVDFYYSSDGQQYTKAGSVDTKTDEKESKAHIETFTAPINTTARYIKIHAKNRKTIPGWHAAAGKKAWIFIDEIMIR